MRDVNGELWMAFIFTILFPIGMFVGSVVLRMMATRKPNAIVGYRTELAFKSPKHWAYAQRISALHFLGVGIITLLLALATFGIMFHYGIRNPNLWWIACSVLTVVSLALLLLIFPAVDRKLRKL
ncbi:MAG: SdpI family protein [Cellulomonadaceae bacterium]|nr:SdpI family protein [Cellulomonadaceae bacterium]